MIRIFPHLSAMITIILILIINFGDQLTEPNSSKKIIEPSKYLGCFTIEPTATYSITLLLNQQAANSKRSFISWLPQRGDDGHAFLKLQQINRTGQKITRFLGRYEREGKWVNEEAKAGSVDLSVEFRLSAFRFEKLLQTINDFPKNVHKSGDPDYGIIIALKSAGINVPEQNCRRFLFDSTPVGSFRNSSLWLDTHIGIEEFVRRMNKDSVTIR